MLFEWAKELLSHYQLGSYDYTNTGFNSNTMKYWSEVLKEDTELKGDVHPIQCSINDGRGQEMPIVSPRTAEVICAFGTSM